MDEKEINRIEKDESILTSIKKLLGIDSEYDQFDSDIIMNINAAFFTLSQIGVGPKEGIVIMGDKETYSLFFNDPDKISQIKMYLYYKTKMGFDPPASSAVMESLKAMIQEAEWRLSVSVDPPDTFGDDQRKCWPWRWR